MSRRRMSDGDDGPVHQIKRQKASTYGSGNGLSYDDYAVAWICALHIEMAAARAMLDEQHDDLPRRVNDTNSYILGTMQRHNVVIACLPAEQYGTNNAASVLSNMKSTFPKIRIGLMVGIGGGVPTKADIRLGDVVVGIRVMQSDLGKTVNGRLQRTAIPKVPDSSIRTVISNLRSAHELSGSRVPLILKDKMRDYPAYRPPVKPDRLFQSSYSHEPSASTCDECDQSKLEARKIRVSTDPVIHYGAIASGNQVMKDAASRDEIARELDVICYEMEAAGLMDIMPCLPIRGICDYSDSHKAKEWQRYAAAAAAAYAYEFLGIWGGDTQPGESYCPLPHNEHSASTERRGKLMESLNFEEIDSRKTTIKAAYSKTCLWFLKHPDYLTWINRREISRHHGFLWIKGKPGAGKSTIMKFLYLKSKTKDRSSQTLTGSFFFNARGGELEKTVSGMYRSLLLQLFRGFPDLQCVLDDPDLVPQAQMSCPSLNVLKDLLRSAVSKLGQRSFTCFIDALDECDEQQVMDMVEYFEDLAEQCTEDGLRLQICFSSRHYPFIDIRLGLCLILEEQVGHTGDLETYINTHLRVRDPSFLAELQTRMLEKAAGVFLWVVLVVEVLNSENRRGRLFLKTRLEEVPSGLSELFKDLLRRDKARMEELLLSILWVLLSKRPLKPEEYYHALWSGLSLEGLADLDPPEVIVADADDCFNRCVISSSKGLAEITKSKHPTVQFIHESVRDFLVKDKGLCELWPELGADWESVGHERLKLCCYSYVELVMSQGQQLLSQLSVEWTYPFLEYASQFVLYHAEHAGNAVDQEAFLDRFPTPVWIGIVNLFQKFWIRRYTQDASLIYIIAERGHSGLIRILLRANPDNPDVDRPVDGERYRYPLIAAMAKGDKNSVIALLGLSSPVFDGVDITETLICNIDAGGTRRTPISWACEHGHLGIAKLLVSRLDDKNTNHGRVWTPLMFASKNGHIDIVKLLIDDGAEIHTTIRQENAISLASANGHAGIVRILLNAGADPHFSSIKGSSLLCLAAGNAHEEVVRLLLEEGVPANRENNSGVRPLHFAARRKGSMLVMKELLRHGADIHAQTKTGYTCLMEAIKEATLDEVEFLIKEKADVTTPDGPNGASCLYYAMIRAKEPCDMVKVILDNGADVNARDFSGRTCLHWIHFRYSSLPSLDRLLQILKNYKVDVNARDNDGNTPLHFLYRAHRSNVPLFFNQLGLDLNAQNHLGETPLHLASREGRFDVSARLIECGTDVNYLDNKGQTPLDVGWNDEIIQLLIESGGIRNTT